MTVSRSLLNHKMHVFLSFRALAASLTKKTLARYLMAVAEVE